MGERFTNIDDLLDATLEIADDHLSSKLYEIEIDSLLENTIHW